MVALIRALEAGADEAVMLDPTEVVATCNATNFFISRGGEVRISTGQYCLNGITRRMAIELCGTNGIPLEHIGVLQEPGNIGVITKAGNSRKTTSASPG